MTESFEDGNYLVRVRAQVMSRDDSSGGWVPLEGGGLSNVSVRKRPRPLPSTDGGGNVGGGGNNNTKPKYDYLIFGKRISDQLVVLSCTIKKDFEYNKVMPTFHHWKTGDKKFGLTFQTAADARAFDKGVRTAVEELLDGFAESHPHSPLHKYPMKDVGDDDVFMTLNLPQEPKDSRSSSDSSTNKAITTTTTTTTIADPLQRLNYIGREKLDPRQLNLDPVKGVPVENYSYVQLTAVHEYIYPVVSADDHPLSHHHHHHPLLRQPKLPQRICETDTSTFKKSSPDQPTSFLKSGRGGAAGGSGTLKKKVGGGRGAQARCKHCHELYLEAHNRRGACEYAPDCARATINAITCLGCAQCVCYHCAADAEGDFARNPCECTARRRRDAPAAAALQNDDDQQSCSKRWLCLAALSVIVPCLWLYPPLKLCHWGCTRCGVCGGRHTPI